MKRIIIAGSGTGGLAVGALLAKDGFDVTLYSDCDPATDTYDWEDSFNIAAIEAFVGAQADASEKGFLRDNRYYGPSECTPVETSFGDTPPAKAHRRCLSRLLTQYALDCGVKIVRHTKVLSALTDGCRVTGIRTRDASVSADLVIDACGVDSPVRKSLPDACGIEQEYAYGDVFFAYRGIFDKVGNTPPDPHAYELYLMHRGEPGLSWFITEEDSTDILLGRFSPFGQEKADAECENFRKNHPQLGNTLLHGGTFGKIPVRRPLAKAVCDGYAAIGDSAYMTYPMSGCGIDLSVRAAKLLHECILADRDGVFTTRTLWRYHYNYIMQNASLAGVEILKNTLLNLQPEKLDVLFDKQIITENDLAGGGAGVSAADLLGRIRRGIFHLPTLLTTAKAALGSSSVEKLYRQIPEEYSPDAFAAWKKKIDKKYVPLRR